MKLGQHVWYYASSIGDAALTTHCGHFDRALDDDGLARLYVRLADGCEEPLEAPRCDAAAPLAGCWSEIP